MERSGFKHLKNWYKGNLHSHTVNSDGLLTPQESVELYKSRGYHFLCLSEHDCYTDYRKEFDSENFIILPGIEASAVLFEHETSKSCRKVHHIHGILGTEKMQVEAAQKGRLFKHMERMEPLWYYGTWNGAKAAQQLSDELRKRGCITTYNHPIWSRVREQEFMDTQGLWAMEIFNYNTVNECNLGYDTTRWDVMLREGKHILGFASDDNHNEGQFDDSFGGFIVVNAETLTHEDIVENMICGNYYSSSGPEIYDWGVKDGRAYVKCSPVSRIDFIAGNCVGDGRSVVCGTGGKTVSEAFYEGKGHETYVRVECTDREGKTAWSNPIFL